MGGFFVAICVKGEGEVKELSGSGWKNKENTKYSMVLFCLWFFLCIYRV